MVLTLVLAALVSLSVLVVARPFGWGGGRALTGADADEELRQALLRQLRDLDDDLACGKLSREDHTRLRRPLERQTAEVLHRLGERPAPAAAPVVATPRARRPHPAPRRRRRIWLLSSGTATAAVAALALLLNGAVAPRGPGSTLTGDAPAVPSARQQGTGGTPAPAPKVTARQVAAVEEAVDAVHRHPRSAAAHLTLARAYTAAAQPQLATIEYLAVTRLDRANAEANTGLALVAFAAGQARQAEKLLTTALTAHPRYPEALYARGLVRLMGLKEPVPARRDLTAYLAAAPYGSHRTTVQTLLAMAPAGEDK